MLLPLPLRLRNRLAGLILAALHDRRARERLEAAAEVGPSPASGQGLPPPLLDAFVENDPSGHALSPLSTAHRSAILERARRAADAMRGRAFLAETPSLDEALTASAWLFDARLYFEVHEHLEPHWRQAHGEMRESLQGLIQAAVGFEHLASGNVPGAVALLHDGCARMLGRRLAGRDLDAFAHDVRECLRALIAVGPAGDGFDWRRVPAFPVAGPGRGCAG